MSARQPVPTCRLLVFFILAGALWLEAAQLRQIYVARPDILALMIVDFDQTGAREIVDTNRVNRTSSYAIRSSDDVSYSSARWPSKVGWKRKVHSYIRGGTAVWSHTMFLQLPSSLKPGKKYTVKLGNLVSSAPETTFVFDPRRLRSETIHVNQIGYDPSARKKYAYLSHWLGDMGSMSLIKFKSTRFHLVDTASGSTVFSGTIALRKDFETGGAESGQSDSPRRIFCASDVWECDFSSFSKPGVYRVVVEGIGCSYPFRIHNDVYRDAFHVAARGLYHQRCGTALEDKYTHWSRPRCHHPDDGLIVRQSRWKYTSGSNAFEQLPANATSERVRYYGGWHDAGDWDRRWSHVLVSHMLLLAYECNPGAFADKELCIPESGNGVPDIIDEAAWGIDLLRRMQKSDGSVCGGLESDGHPFSGQWSGVDSKSWFAYAPEAVPSMGYAAAGANLAWCLKKAGAHTRAAGYISTARKAYDYAVEKGLNGSQRGFAAAWLYRATGDSRYHTDFKNHHRVGSSTKMETSSWSAWAAFAYALAPSGVDGGLQGKLKNYIISYARNNRVETAGKRGFRWANYWWSHTGIGGATTPKVISLMVAYRLSGDKTFLDCHQTTCDYFLGGNPLNMCWVTGLGRRSPKALLHLDSRNYWEPRGCGVVAGIVPYGPHAIARDDDDYDKVHYMVDLRAEHLTLHPDRFKWPSHELWFEDAGSSITNEFTVHENMGPAVAAYAALCGTTVSHHATAETGVCVDELVPTDHASGHLPQELKGVRWDGKEGAVYDLRGRRLGHVHGKVPERGVRIAVSPKNATGARRLLRAF